MDAMAHPQDLGPRPALRKHSRDRRATRPSCGINNLAPARCALYVKAEFFNPAASVKDRLALNIIEAAERSGALKPGQTVVEATSGNTGIGLAMVCAQKGYPLVVTMADSFSVERRRLMRMMGAKVVLTPRAQKGTGMYMKAVELAKKHGWFLARQFETQANADIHEATTAREIIGDFAGDRLDYVVTGYGTGGTVTGLARVLRKERPETQDHPVRACQCRADRQRRCAGAGRGWRARGKPPAFEPHPIQGWTPDFIPLVLQEAIDKGGYDELIPVTGADGMAWAKKLAAREGILTGISGGATFAVAMQIAETRRARFRDPRHAARHRRALSHHAAVRDIPEDMDDEERALSQSTPGYRITCLGEARRSADCTPRTSTEENSPMNIRNYLQRGTLDPADWTGCEAGPPDGRLCRRTHQRRATGRSGSRCRTLSAQHIPTPLPQGRSRSTPSSSEMRENLFPYAMGNIHPRFWVWYMGAGNFTGALADFLAAIDGSNLGGGDTAANLVDQQVTRWIIQMMGFPEGASAALVNGGSMANIVGLTAARNAMAGVDLHQESVADMPAPLASTPRTRCTTATKAMNLLGLGERRCARWRRTRHSAWMSRALRQAIAADRETGVSPACVIATAGTTNTGVDRRSARHRRPLPRGRAVDACGRLHRRADHDRAGAPASGGRDRARGFPRPRPAQMAACAVRRGLRPAARPRSCTGGPSRNMRNTCSRCRAASPRASSCTTTLPRRRAVSGRSRSG